MDQQSQSRSSSDKLSDWCQKNPILCALIVILIVVVIYQVFMRKERMQPFYLDQIAMKSSDPTVVKFLGRERDPLGMSLRDYYTENTMMANNVVMPRPLGDQMYANHTSYLQMPRWYRPPPDYKPRPLSALVGQSDNVTTAMNGDTELDTSAVDSGTAEVVAVESALAKERMNQRNKNGRERFLY